MGVMSTIHRFREVGERVNINNEERFGLPDHSLFTTTKLFTLHHHIDIVDEREQVVYQANTKFPSLHDKTDVTAADGRQVAHIERKIFSLHQRHFVTMADGTQFQLSTELFHLIKDITNIEGLGWQLRGNILALNFELYDADESVIAVIGQKALSIHDKYCIDIYRPEYEDAVVAILVALQHIIQDRQNRSSSFSSSSSSSGS
ncbi:MAG: LURP-one-related family protein [Clostridia bacterium]|nr:LURP-one-related family protein [Clostridia bacterium]